MPGAATPLAVVTGARGFVGAALVASLRRDGYRVVGIDLPVRAAQHEPMRLLAHDLTAPLPAGLLDGAELVVHAAALAGVQPSWKRPLDYWRANVLATELLRAACVEAGVPRVVHLSSISVYGEGERLAESAPARPLSPYGITKLAGELVWRGYPNALIVRLSNVYGPGQRPDMAYATFIRAALAGRSVELRDGGRQRRTPTYIDDCVAGIVGVARGGSPGSAYNIVGPQHVRLTEVHRLLETILARRIPAVTASRAPGDPRCATVSSGRARRELAYAPLVDLREGLVRQLRAATDVAEGEWARAATA